MIMTTAITTGIKKGNIVKHNGGWGRVTRVTKTTVNLGGVWGTGRILKQIPLEEVVEDAKGFFAYWEKTDAYRCM